MAAKNARRFLKPFDCHSQHTLLASGHPLEFVSLAEHHVQGTRDYRWSGRLQPGERTHGHHWNSSNVKLDFFR